MLILDPAMLIALAAIIGLHLVGAPQALIGYGQAYVPRMGKLLPYGRLVGGSAHVVAYPAGRGVEVSAVDHGHAAELLYVPKGGQLFTLVIATAGSHRAKKEYPGMLQSLALPNE